MLPPALPVERALCYAIANTIMTTSGQRVIVTGLLQDRAGRVLIICPAGEPGQPKVWWLPGAELPSGERPAQFLRQAIGAQLGLDVQPGNLYLTAHRLATTDQDEPEFVLLFDCGHYDETDVRARIRMGAGIALWYWATLAQAGQRLDPDEADRVRWVLLSRPRFGGYLEHTRDHHDDSGGADAAHDAPGRHAARTGS